MLTKALPTMANVTPLPHGEEMSAGSNEAAKIRSADGSAAQNDMERARHRLVLQTNTLKDEGRTGNPQK